MLAFLTKYTQEKVSVFAGPSSPTYRGSIVSAVLITPSTVLRYIILSIVVTILLSILRPQIKTNQCNPLATLPDWLATHGHEFCHFVFEYAITLQTFIDWDSFSPYFKSRLEPHYNKDSFCLRALDGEEVQYM